MTDEPTVLDAIEALVDVGLWIPTEEGWIIEDSHQPAVPGRDHTTTRGQPHQLRAVSPPQGGRSLDVSTLRCRETSS